MQKSIDFSQTGGLYVYQDTLDFMQKAYSDCIAAIAAMFGDKVIVAGLQPTGGGALTDGWVVYTQSGATQLIPVQGGAQLTYLHLTQTVSPEQYADGTSKSIYTEKYFSFTGVSGGNIAFSSFKRLPYTSNTIYEALSTIKDIINKVVGLESAVILSGCMVSAVNVGAGTCNISAGSVLMDGDLISSVAYSGSYPVYLKPDGNFQTSVPSGTYVKFDYETSQRYMHVLKRSMHGSGEIVMSRSSSDLALFDAATGLGKWKWQGWKICDVLQSRMPLGYDRRTSAPSGDDSEAWDSAYNTLNNFGGEKKHQLTVPEMPAHSHNLQLPGDGSGEDGVTFSDTPTYTGKNFNTNSVGGDQKHENRSPYRVILFIERI